MYIVRGLVECTVPFDRWYRRVVVGLSFQKLEVSPSVRSNTSERCARDQHPSTSNNLLATIIPTQTPDIIHQTKTNSHTHNPSQCLSSSAAPVLSLLPQRRSQQQRPRSRWSLACSTSKSLCEQSLRILRRLNTPIHTDPPFPGSLTPAPRSAFLLSTAKPTSTRASPSASTAA